MNPVIKKILINTVSNYLLRILQITLSIIAVPIIINNLGEESFGLIALANAVLGYFVLIDISIPTGVTKYVAEFLAKKEFIKINDVINTSIILFIALGCFVSIATILFTFLGGLSSFNISIAKIENAKNLLLISAVFSIFAWPRKVFEGAFKGLQKYYKVNLILGIGRILGIILAIVVSLLQKSVEIVFVAMNLEVFITSIWLYISLRKELDNWQIEFKFDKSTFKLLFGFSSWLFLSQLAGLLEYNSDSIIIGSILTVDLITSYTILMNPFRLIQQVAGLAASAIMPAVSESQVVNGKAGVDIFIFQGVKYHNLLFVPWAIIGVYFCQPFIRLWVGPEYLEYIWVAQLACVFQLIWQSNALLGQVYLGTGQVKKLSLLALTTGIFNVLLSILLAHVIGFVGVILGTIFIGTISVPFLIWLVLPDLQVSTKLYLKNVLLNTQLPLWIGGLLFLPFWNYIQNIQNWFIFFTFSAIMGIVLYVVGWYFVVDSNIKEIVLRKIKFYLFK